MKKVLVGLVLGTLLSFILTFNCGRQVVRAGAAVYIHSDGSIDPPTAPIQRNGNVYTLTEDIKSNVDGDGIVVERDSIVVEGSGFTVEGIGSYNYSGPSGICLHANHVIIRNMNIKLFYNGIFLAAYSNHNNISGNTIAYNGFGFYISSSSYNDINKNNVTYNGFGFFLSKSSYNNINGNIVIFNSLGLCLSSSPSNHINGNTIAKSNYGIELYGSSNNTVCHNNFVDNAIQLDNPTPRYTNFWDNGCEGSYWSNYDGTDLDDCGVGDVNLPWEGVDNYPLMSLYWSPCDINHDLKVDMRDIGKSAAALDTVSGDALWNPHADITGSTPIVADGKVDMQDVNLIAMHFGEHCSLAKV